MFAAYGVIFGSMLLIVGIVSTLSVIISGVIHILFGVAAEKVRRMILAGVPSAWLTGIVIGCIGVTVSALMCVMLASDSEDGAAYVFPSALGVLNVILVTTLMRRRVRKTGARSD